MIVFTLSVFDQEFGRENQDCQINLKLGLETNANMQKPMVIFTFLFSTENILFQQIRPQN